MITRRTFAAALPAVLAANRLRGETLEERGRKLKDKMVEALGGDYFVAMHDRTEEGRAYSFFREELSGLSIVHIYTQYLEKGGPGDFPAIRERQSFLKSQDDAIIFAENAAFEVNFHGARPLADDRLQRYIETTQRNIFYIVRQRLNEPGMIFESPGGDIKENQQVEILDITDSQNRTMRVWLHHLTFLPIMQEFKLMDPQLKERRTETTRYSNYRSVKPGVMWPFSVIRERDGEKVFQMFAESVTVNSDLPAKLFSLPAGIKILKKDT
ncbi:MAG TPA: hypothetical protein VGL72_27415 [Bryobacteraceae bacterium]|jgi:hypothetical protein